MKVEKTKLSLFPESLKRANGQKVVSNMNNGSEAREKRVKEAMKHFAESRLMCKIRSYTEI